MVTGCIKFDSIWITEVIKNALAQKIGGGCLKVFKVHAFSRENKVHLVVRSLIETTQGDETEANISTDEIDAWLEAAVVDRGYERGLWATHPRLWMVGTEFGYSFTYEFQRTNSQ